jgi:hypothetical protein
MKGLVFYLLSAAAIFGAGAASAENVPQNFLSRAQAEIRQSLAEARGAGWRNDVRGDDIMTTITSTTTTTSDV